MHFCKNMLILWAFCNCQIQHLRQKNIKKASSFYEKKVSTLKKYSNHYWLCFHLLKTQQRWRTFLAKSINGLGKQIYSDKQFSPCCKTMRNNHISNSHFPSCSMNVNKDSNKAQNLVAILRSHLQIFLTLH